MICYTVVTLAGFVTEVGAALFFYIGVFRGSTKKRTELTKFCPNMTVFAEDQGM